MRLYSNVEWNKEGAMMTTRYRACRTLITILALSLINRISALTKLLSASPDKRDKYVNEIISAKKNAETISTVLKAQETTSNLLKEKGNALVRVVGSTPGQTNRIPFIMYVSAISFAEYSIHMTNSYFFPDDQIVKALTDAAGRGVDVKIILPGITDSKLALYAQRYHYSRLLKSGVKLYERNTSLLHAKTAVVDKVWSTVGSTNMDFLSLLNNDEVNAVILSKEFAVEMENMFVKDLADSTQIQWDEWKERPLLPRVREWFVNLFDRWL